MNMKDFIRIAFCITAVALTLSVCRPLSFEIGDFNIEPMKSIKCDSNVKLYSPTNVEDECFTSALECIQEELKVVQVECEETDPIYMANVTLYHAIRILKTEEGGNTNPTKCACEKWNQVSFHNFLDNFESLLQEENSKNAMKGQ